MAAHVAGPEHQVLAADHVGGRVYRHSENKNIHVGRTPLGFGFQSYDRFNY